MPTTTFNPPARATQDSSKVSWAITPLGVPKTVRQRKMIPSTALTPCLEKKRPCPGKRGGPQDTAPGFAFPCRCPAIRSFRTVIFRLCRACAGWPACWIWTARSSRQRGDWGGAVQQPPGRRGDGRGRPARRGTDHECWSASPVRPSDAGPFGVRWTISARRRRGRRHGGWKSFSIAQVPFADVAPGGRMVQARPSLLEIFHHPTLARQLTGLGANSRWLWHRVGCTPATGTTAASPARRRS